MGGNTFSTPRDTKTPTILNFIQKEMFARADLVDIYSLADPARCSKYIVVAADALETLFVKIKIDPAATKEGTLYFQSIDGLAKGTSQAAKDAQVKRKIYCRQLAFFFIRIFQTFAALAISILDSELPATDPEPAQPTGQAVQKRATFIDPKSFLAASRSTAMPRLFGGALVSERAGRPGSFYIQTEPYKILNMYLNEPSDKASGDALKFSDFSSLRISQKSLYIIPADDNYSARAASPNPRPQLFYTFVRDDVEYTASAMLTFVRSGDDLTVTFQNFALNGTTDMGKTEIIVLHKSSIDDHWMYTDRKFQEAYQKRLPWAFRAVMDQYAISKKGAPKLPVFKLLSDLGYLRQITADKYLVAEHLVIFSSQDKEEIVGLSFADYVSIPGETRKEKVYIKDILFGFTSTRIQDSSDGSRTYNMKLDFSKARFEPTSPLEDYVQFPETPIYVKFIAKTRAGVPRSDKSDLTIPEWLEKKVQAIVANKEEDLPDGTGIKYTRQGLPIPHDSEAMGEGFRIKGLWKALAKDPPVKSHCVARATQLLSVNAIRGALGEDAFSSICRTKFAYQADGSLPTPGESIYKPAAGDKQHEGEYAIYALAMLFIERLGSDGMPKFGDSAKYKSFLANLKFAFEKTKAVDMATAPESLGQITEKLPGFCETIGDNRIALPKSLASSLQGVTRRLYSQQVKHVGAVMNLIFKLFDRDSIINRGLFALHPNLLKGGTPAVNAVAAEARELLLNYYKGCELTYREGLNLIVTENQRQPLKAVGSA